MIDPFEEIERLRQRLNKLMKHFWEPWAEPVVRGVEWFPVDVVGTPESVEIFGSKREERKEVEESVLRAERKYGTCRRYISLLVEVEPESAGAKLEHECLRLGLRSLDLSERLER